MEPQTWRTADVEKVTAVPASTIRSWRSREYFVTEGEIEEEVGRILAAGSQKVERRGWPNFTLADIVRVAILARCSNLGMAIEQIARQLTQEMCDLHNFYVVSLDEDDGKPKVLGYYNQAQRPAVSSVRIEIDVAAIEKEMRSKLHALKVDEE